MPKISPLEKQVHLMSLKEIQKKFQVNFHTGLSSSQVRELSQNRRVLKGPSYNRIMIAILKSLYDNFSLLLWFCLIEGIIEHFFLGEDPTLISWLSEMAIIILNFIVKSTLTGLEEFKSVKMIRKLQSPNVSLVHVLRDSTWSYILACDLVIGDIVEIKTNQYVPAVLRLFYVNNLCFDKSILTGESEPVEAMLTDFENLDKNSNFLEAKNMSFFNFFVLSGYGRGVVVSLQNDIDNNSVNSFSRENRINKGLKHFAFLIGLMSAFAGISNLIIWAAWLRAVYSHSWQHALDSILDICSSVVPIGFSVVLTAGLFIAWYKLRKHNVLIKNMYSIYSMTDVDVILTDKTGTLTKNSLEVTNVLYSTIEIDVDLCMQSPDVFLGARNALAYLLDLCEFCTNDPANSTEQALFDFARKNKPGSRLLIDRVRVIDEIPFSSNSKYQVKVVEIHEENTNEISYELWVRGAHDILLSKSKYCVLPDGLDVSMDIKDLDIIQRKILNWLKYGRRVISICRKPLLKQEIDYIKKSNDLNKWFCENCNDLVVLGCIGFIDSPRPCVKESIRKLREMNVRIVMVTGDYSTTAVSIALQVGILTNPAYDTLSKFRAKKPDSKIPSYKKSSIVLNGQEIEQLKSDEWKSICSNYTEIILSRAKPAHKLTCVKQFQSNKSTVLMIGDGVNDVPALKQANVSVTLAAGSKMASSVADVVLANNVFSNLPLMLLAGRQIFLSIKKSMLLLMISSMSIYFLSLLLTNILGFPRLLANTQMTIISAFTDLLPAIALFFGKPEPNETRRLDEKLVNARIILMGLLFMGPLTTILAYLNVFAYLAFYQRVEPTDLVLRFDESQETDERFLVAQSIALYSIVVMQSFGNLYSLKTRRSLFFESLPFIRPYRDWCLLVGSLFVVVIVTFLVSFTIQDLTEAIPNVFYATSIGCSMLILIIHEIRKFLMIKCNTLKPYLSW